jgi:hypothetical protein
MNDPAGLPPGQIRLFDNYVPELTGGEYTIEVSQAVPAATSESPTSEQRFVVVAPQIAVDPAEVVQVFPPNGSIGRYGDLLPFVLLAEPALPWERKMAVSGRPWLALLVLEPGELIGGDPAADGANTVTTEGFLGLKGTLVPRLDLEADVAPGDPCRYIEISTKTFAEVVPHADELALLAHVRQSPAAAAPGEDLRSVVLANRFPAIEGSGPTRSVVHLVSLEGLEPFLVPGAVFTPPGQPHGAGLDRVALISLASWSFQSLPDPAESFEGLALDLLASEYDEGREQHTPEHLRLQLPTPDPPGTGAAAKTVASRVEAGYVPLAYHSRTGEETFAWYRGPLVPELPTGLDKEGPFLSADAALAYDEASGSFDASLAAAWQIGRSTALADRAFATTLLDLRRRLHLLTDKLHDRLARDEFAAVEQIAALEQERQLPKRLLEVLDADLLAELGQGPGPGSPPPAVPGRPPNAATELRNFLADEENQAAILALVAEDLDPVAKWLARLSLLGPVPFSHLVADPRMLPAASPPAADPEKTPLTGAVRFFYIDPNWIGALLDGALSIGLESSLHTFFHGITAGLIVEAAGQAAANEGVISGLLLRSPLVSGWPDLELHPLDADGKAMRVLRLQRLAPGILIALFDGIPAHVKLAEPQVGILLGTDPHGNLELRRTQGPEAGSELGKLLPVRDPDGVEGRLMREPGSRVLRLVSESEEGLVAKLVAELRKAGEPVEAGSFNAAALALQLIDAPQDLAFVSRSGS